jgi:hypothetical protein
MILPAAVLPAVQIILNSVRIGRGDYYSGSHGSGRGYSSAASRKEEVEPPRSHFNYTYWSKKIRRLTNQ